MKKTDAEEFQLTGAFIPMIPDITLTDSHRDAIRRLIPIKDRTIIGRFISRLEEAVNHKRRADELRSAINLVSVKARLKDIRKLSTSLLKELDRSDGHSWDLLASQGRGPTITVPDISEKDGIVSFGLTPTEAPGMNVHECLHAVFTLQHFADEALKQLPQSYSGKRKKSLDNVDLGISIAGAMDEILDIRPVSGSRKPFSELLVLLLYIAGDEPRSGTDPFTRDVRKLVSASLKSYQSEL